MREIRVSVCYIVKNEEKNLPISLETVKDIADELVIVDTGSTDSTLRIAEEAGARVFHFQWCDDFAAARNHALDQATGDWIVFLDADEGFLHPEKVLAKLREIDGRRPPVDGVIVADINISPETGEQLGICRPVRAFRNLPRIRYQGRIHETIASRDGTLRLCQDDGGMSMYHTGYTEGVRIQKAKRNLRLLLRDAAENGEQQGQYMYLAQCYFGLEDYKAALRYAVLALDSPVQPLGSRVELFHLAIESMRCLAWPLEDQLALAEMAVGEYPEQPEFYGERGMILCGMGRLEDARDSLVRAMTIYEGNRIPVSAETYFTDKTASLVYRRLGELEEAIGTREAAERYYRKAEAGNGNDGDMG